MRRWRGEKHPENLLDEVILKLEDVGGFIIGAIKIIVGMTLVGIGFIGICTAFITLILGGVGTMMAIDVFWGFVRCVLAFPVGGICGVFMSWGITLVLGNDGVDYMSGPGIL